MSTRPALAWGRADAGAERRASPAAAILWCDAAGPHATPRRFQPRLAAGFDEQAGDGLRDFDRSAPSWPSAARLVIAVIGLATFAGILIAQVS